MELLVDCVFLWCSYDGTSDQIIGFDALRKNVFWSRVATGVFSFISFVVMSTVPYVTHKSVSARKLFLVSVD